MNSSPKLVKPHRQWRCSSSAQGLTAAKPSGISRGERDEVPKSEVGWRQLGAVPCKICRFVRLAIFWAPGRSAPQGFGPLDRFPLAHCAPEFGGDLLDDRLPSALRSLCLRNRLMPRERHPFELHQTLNFLPAIEVFTSSWRHVLAGSVCCVRV